MKNEVTVKVNKLGKAGQIIVNISKAVISIALVCSILGTVALALLPKDKIVISTAHQAEINVQQSDSAMGVSVIVGADESDSSMELNGIQYEITNIEQDDKKIRMTAEAAPSSLSLHNLWWTTAVLSIYLTSTLVVLHFVGKLCKNFRYCESPFTEEIVKSMRSLAFALIPMALLSSTGEAVTDSLMTGRLNIVVGVDLAVVLLVLLIFLLAAIFRYGAMLQQESDETL